MGGVGELQDLLVIVLRVMDVIVGAAVDGRAGRVGAGLAVLFGRAGRRGGKHVDLNGLQLGRRGGVGHLFGFDAGQVEAEVLQESPFHHRLESLVSVHFFGAFGKASLELVDDGRIGRLGHGCLLPLEVLQVLDGFLQDVGLFEF